MPTFYDSIELEDVDIDDDSARFYIIKMPGSAGLYKVCATTQNLTSPAMIGGDPETRIKYYYPITREQLNGANFDTLFFDNKIRTAPMTKDELQAAFHFNPIEQQPRKFGISHASNQVITWESIPPVASGDWTYWGDTQESAWIVACKERITQMADVVGMSQEQHDVIIRWFEEKVDEYRIMGWIPQSMLDFFHTEQYPFNVLVQFDATDLTFAINSAEVISLLDILNVYTQAQSTGMDSNSIQEIISNPSSMIPILNGTLTIDDYVNQIQIYQQLRENEEYRGIASFLLFPNCIIAVKEGYCTAEELLDLGDRRISLIIHTDLINAIRDGRTTFETLSELSMQELRHVVATDEYPGNGTGLAH